MSDKSCFVSFFKCGTSTPASEGCSREFHGYFKKRCVTGFLIAIAAYIFKIEL